MRGPAARATVKTRDIEGAGIPVREIVIDCRHAMTTGQALNAGAELDVVRILAMRHGATCRCAEFLLEQGAPA